MDNSDQWVITTIVGILTLLAGRYWRFLDHVFEHDLNVYKKILEILPSNGSILFIRQHDFGASFEVDQLQDFYNFLEYSLRPEIRFIGKKLERLRKKLVDNTSVFNSYLGTHTWRLTSSNSRINKMKDPDEFSSDEEYSKEKEKINELSALVCQSYDDLVSQATNNAFFKREV